MIHVSALYLFFTRLKLENHLTFSLRIFLYLTETLLHRFKDQLPKHAGDVIPFYPEISERFKV
jgi:hypothetical protein